jgi:hypothetical protein
MMLEILKIAHAMVRETLLPDMAASEAERESSFDELNGTFEGDFFRGCEQQMDVVGHDHEFVQQIFSFVSVMSECVDEEIGDCSAAKNWKARGCDRRNKKRAVEVHFVMVIGWELVVCDECHETDSGVSKRKFRIEE